jgi:hypothetical protein
MAGVFIHTICRRHNGWNSTLIFPAVEIDSTFYAPPKRQCADRRNHAGRFSFRLQAAARDYSRPPLAAVVKLTEFLRALGHRGSKSFSFNCRPPLRQRPGRLRFAIFSSNCRAIFVSRLSSVIGVASAAVIHLLEKHRVAGFGPTPSIE